MLSTKRIRLTPVGGRDRPVWDRQAILSLSLEDENYDFPMSSVQYYVAGKIEQQFVLEGCGDYGDMRLKSEVFSEYFHFCLFRAFAGEIPRNETASSSTCQYIRDI